MKHKLLILSYYTSFFLHPIRSLSTIFFHITQHLVSLASAASVCISKHDWLRLFSSNSFIFLFLLVFALLNHRTACKEYSSIASEQRKTCFSFLFQLLILTHIGRLTYSALPEQSADDVESILFFTSFDIASVVDLTNNIMCLDIVVVRIGL